MTEPLFNESAMLIDTTALHEHREEMSMFCGNDRDNGMQKSAPSFPWNLPTLCPTFITSIKFYDFKIIFPEIYDQKKSLYCISML